MNIDSILITKKSAIMLMLTIGMILLIPLIAMQFTHEVNWLLGDFVVAGVLLSFFGYLYNVLTQNSGDKYEPAKSTTSSVQRQPVRKVNVRKVVIGCVLFVLLVGVWVSLI